MKIFYSHDIFSEQEYGGVSRYITEVIRRVSSICDAEVVSGLYFNEYLNQIKAECNTNGVRINKKFINKFALRCLNEFYQSLRLAPESESVLHQTYYSPFLTKSKLSVVVTVHDMVHELFPDVFPGFNITSFAKKNSCANSDKIIAVSHSTKKDLINIFGIDTEKIEVIYHGSSFHDKYSNVQPYKRSKPYILFVGSRKLYKNFDGLLKAFYNSDRLKKDFEIICFGGGQFTKLERDTIYDFNLHNVVHHDSGSDSRLAEFYAGAEALAYPSRYEGFGIPVLEAMSMSCPVICSNQSSLPEVAADAAIYFDPNDIEHIQFVLEQTLFNKQALANTVLKGLERYKIFTWDKTAHQTFEVYKSLCN